MKNFKSFFATKDFIGFFRKCICLLIVHSGFTYALPNCSSILMFPSSKNILLQKEQKELLIEKKISGNEHQVQRTGNPLIDPSDLPHGTVNFPAVFPVHFIPAFNHAKQIDLTELEAIVQTSEEPTVQNTIVKLSEWNWNMSRVIEVLNILIAEKYTSELNEIFIKIKTDLDNLFLEIFSRKDMFNRVKTIYETRGVLKEDEARLTKKVYELFEKAGMSLEGNKKDRYRQIVIELIELKQRYNSQLIEAKSIDNFRIHVTNPHEVEGIPEAHLSKAKEVAKSLGLEGWVFGSNVGLRIDVATFAKSDSLRRRFLEEHSKIGNQPPNDNGPLTKKIAQLMNEAAQLLGYEHQAQYVLKSRMMGTPGKAFGFVHDLIYQLLPVAKEQVAYVQNYKATTTGDPAPLTESEVLYWENKVRNKIFNFDKEKLRPYFEVNNVLNGLFIHAEKLFGLSFKERPDVPVFDKDVKVYEAFIKKSEPSEEKSVGLLYIDLYERSNEKRGGAWANNFRPQGVRNGQNLTPLVLFAMNIQKPTQGEQTFLSVDEVSTAFHEFGHSLHCLLSAVRFTDQAGYNVLWDFAEFPSQFFENFATNQESLDLFAYHYETKEKIPKDLLKNYLDSIYFFEAYFFLRQLRLSLLDEAWYRNVPEDYDKVDIVALEDSIWEPTRLVTSVIPRRPFSTNFSHIFTGDYHAGYYGYQWTLALQAHVFSLFIKNGIFNSELVEKIRSIYSAGDTRDPMEMITEFLGENPNANALLKLFKVKLPEWNISPK